MSVEPKCAPNLGTLHYRGAKFWAIYTDQFGRNVEVNTGTNNRAEARLFLGRRVIEVLKAKLAAVEGRRG
jgi:hypothetical protein